MKLCDYAGPTPSRLPDQGRFPARVLRTQRPREPRGASHDKSLHILPPDERDMFAKSLAIDFDQPLPMSILLTGHFGEQFRRGRKIQA